MLYGMQEQIKSSSSKLSDGERIANRRALIDPMSQTIITPKVEKVSVIQDGEHVIVVKEGSTILDLPWQAAQMLGKALIIKGNEAEQIAKAEATIMDQAILYRTGAPFAFSTDPRIDAEARKESVWNRTLRRYIKPRFHRAGGIASKEKFGKPEVKDGE